MKKRSDLSIMLRLIKLVKPLAGYMTLLMGFGFVMMSRVPVARVILAVVWVCHIIYFVFGVKTIKTEK